MKLIHYLAPKQAEIRDVQEISSWEKKVKTSTSTAFNSFFAFLLNVPFYEDNEIKFFEHEPVSSAVITPSCSIKFLTQTKKDPDMRNHNSAMERKDRHMQRRYSVNHKANI